MPFLVIGHHVQVVQRFAAWSVGDSLAIVPFMAEQGICPPGHLYQCDFFLSFQSLKLQIEPLLQNKGVNIGSVSQYTELIASPLKRKRKDHMF